MIRKAIGTVKDQTSISLAKVNSTTMLSTLHVAIVNATRHSDHPADDRHVRGILAITSRSTDDVTACVAALSRRLRKTRSWAVAIKSLALVHRLLADGDPAYEEEVLSARMLEASGFRDASGSAASCDFSAFVRSYARYLEGSLELRMRGGRRRRGRRRRGSRGGGWKKEEGTEAAAGNTPVREMKTERIFARAQQLQQLLDRFLACRPTGAAENHRLVAVVLYPLVKESFQIYFDLAQVIGIFVDRFMELPVFICVRVCDVFTWLSKQLKELDMFYNWCKSAGISRASELPNVDHISPQKLEMMDNFIKMRSMMAQSKPKKELLKPNDNSVVTGEEHGEKPTLSLFDDDSVATTPTEPAWVQFQESSDWEAELVWSASSLSIQRAALGDNFDMLLLDEIYNHVAVAVSPKGEGNPFAVSLAVAPTAWVLAEQQMWQRYVGGGMQGDMGMGKLQISPYPMGGCTHMF